MFRAVSGAFTHRLLQTMVVFVALAASTAAAVLGVTLLTSAAAGALLPAGWAAAARLPKGGAATTLRTE